MSLSAPSIENATDIEAIAELLRALPIGETLTYAEISTAIGRDIKARRWLIVPAIRRAETETGALYAVVWRQGYQRLPAENAPQVGSSALRSIRRRARRAAARLAGATGNVAPDIQRALIAQRSALGAIAEMTKERSVNRIGAALPETPVVLPIGRTLEMFRE
jgi:alkylated DNA nucleotide flippase Atl1